MLDDANDRWVRDLLLPNLMRDSASAIEYVSGKTVLLTGAGGCIGSALAHEILSGKPRELLLLDHSEQALYQLGQSLSYLSGRAGYHLAPGDVGDLSLIAALLEEFAPDLLVHAAAYNHIPLMEANALAAVQNNAILTWQLARRFFLPFAPRASLSFALPYAT